MRKDRKVFESCRHFQDKLSTWCIVQIQKIEPLLKDLSRVLFIILILISLFSLKGTYEPYNNLREESALFPTTVESTDTSWEPTTGVTKPLVTPTMTPTPTPTITPTEVQIILSTYRQEEIDSTKHKKKIYTDYRAVTLKSSEQYKLLQKTVTDSRTGIRVIEDKYGDLRYCVALGQYWARNQIGLMVDFHMENGYILKCVVCDVKQDIHTIGGKGKYGSAANDLIEFYLDSGALKVCDWYIDGNGKRVSLVYPAGDVSHAGEEFKGGIKSIIIYDEIVDYR